MSIAGFKEWLRPYYLRSVYFRRFPEKKPAYFETCWSYPEADPDSVRPSDLPDVLFLPMNDWHTRVQRTHHLAYFLSRKGHRCVYLNPHLGREFPYSYGRRSHVRLTSLAHNIFELHVHLPREPVFHHRLLRPSEDNLLVNALLDVLRRLRSASAVQIVAFPVWLETALALRDRAGCGIVYDCHDYLPGFRGIGPEILDREPGLFAKSDLVVCSAESLMRRAAEFGVNNGRSMLLRNAASLETFAVARVPRASDAPVVVGYIGALDFWFDVESVFAAAGAHPEWIFELVGRIEHPSIEKLRSLPNVHFAGEVPYQELGAFLSRFSVSIIPFLPSPLVSATDPIKLYEYLAAGLPVVSSSLPEIRRLSEVVSFYNGPSEFVQQLEAAVASESDEKVRRRRARAQAETWEARGYELTLRLQHLEHLQPR